MSKFIGTSFSACLISLEKGDMTLDKVAFILTSTAYPSREVMIEQIRQVMLSKAIETHVANAIALWDSGRIYQASTRQPAHMPTPGTYHCWVPAPEMFCE